MVTIGGVDATLSSAFTYSNPAAPPEWHVADQKTNGDGEFGSQSQSIDRPDNVSSGDLLVFIIASPFEYINLDACTGASPPSGFTLAAEGGNGTLLNGFDPMIQVWTKTATGSEPSSYSYTLPDNSNSARAHYAVMGRVTNASSVGDSDHLYQSGNLSNIDAPGS